MTDNLKPFRDLWDALIFYRTKNPARALAINLLEVERGGYHEARFSAADLWAAVVCAIHAAEINSSREERVVLRACLTGPWEELLHPVEVAARLRRSERTIYRLKRRCTSLLERELQRRGLV